MTTGSKFNFGDEVWLLSDKGIEKVYIYGIFHTLGEFNKIEVHYNISSVKDCAPPKMNLRVETLLFNSPEELINHYNTQTP
jgi:hypothetical protein